MKFIILLLLCLVSFTFAADSYDPLWMKKQDCFKIHRKCINNCVKQNKANKNKEKVCMTSCSNRTQKCYNTVKSKYCYCKMGQYAEDASYFNQAECACDCSSVDCILPGHGIE